jgi:hypothetical protein
MMCKRIRWALALSSLGVFFVSAFPAEARSALGPSVVTEKAGPARVKSEKGADEERDLAAERVRAILFAPVPVGSPRVLLMPGFNYVRETQRWEAKPRGEEAGVPVVPEIDHPTAKNMSSFAPNASVVLQPAAKGDPLWYLTAARHGGPNFTARARPMTEVIGASVLDGFGWRLSPGDETETLLAYRWRHFPHGDRHLLIVGHKITTSSGWIFDAAIPSHGLIGYDDRARGFVYTAGARMDSIQYPFDTPGAESGMSERAWLEGYTTSLLLGVRGRIAGMLHLTVEFGAQSQTVDLYSEDADKLAKYSTAYAPWARVGFLTVADVP